MQRWQAEATAAKAEARTLDEMLAGLQSKWRERERTTRAAEARALEKRNAEVYAARLAAEAAAAAAEEDQARRVAKGRRKKLALDRRNDRLKERTTAYCDRYFGRGMEDTT